MAAPVSPTFLLNWTNIWYQDLDNGHNASLLASPVLSGIRFKKTGGDSVAQPFVLNGHRGDSGDFQAAQAMGSQPDFRASAKYRWQVTYPEYHGSIMVPHRDIALSRNDRDAAVEALQYEIDMAFAQRATNIMRMWFAPIGNSMGTGTLAAGVFTMSDRIAASRMFQGDMVQFSATDGASGSTIGSPGFLTRSESEVAASSNGRLTISAISATGATGNPTGVPDGVYNIFRYGEFNSTDTNSKVIPIQAYIPAAPATTDLFNVRRQNDTRLSGLRVPDAVLGGCALSTKIKRFIAQAVNIAAVGPGVFDQIVMNPVDWQTAEEEFTATVGRSPSEEGEDGFMRMKINSARGKATILSEPLCPQGTAFAFTSRELTFHSPSGKIAEWLPADARTGDLVRRKESEPVYELNPISYVATVMRSPFVHGRFSTTV